MLGVWVSRTEDGGSGDVGGGSRKGREEDERKREEGWVGGFWKSMEGQTRSTRGGGLPGKIIPLSFHRHNSRTT